jgi:hypothetical protein
MEYEQYIPALNLNLLIITEIIKSFNFFNTHTKIKIENNVRVQSFIISLPPELFIIICSFLPPNDLYSLSKVCRKFHEYLSTSNSSTTQQIWKESRLKFMPNETMPPPEGMIEKRYVELLMINLGCQICKQNKCELCWGLEIRCCEECLLNNCVTYVFFSIFIFCNLLLFFFFFNNKVNF